MKATVRYNLGQNKWKTLAPLPPNQRWENGAFWLLRDFILDLGGGGGGMGVCCTILFRPRLYNLGQNKWKTLAPPPPPPPNQRWENGAFWLLRDFILDLGGWGFAVPFYCVQDCSLLACGYKLQVLMSCVFRTESPTCLSVVQTIMESNW